MQFNPGDGSGIVDEIDGLCDSDITSYPLAAKTRRANTALETLVADILTADGKWQFDDTNYSDRPIGTGDLIEGQSAYSFASSFLDIEWIKIKNLGGKWVLIKPRDQMQTNIPLEEYYDQSGFPIFYDKEGTTIQFGPAPTATSVTLIGGLKVAFKRTASLFTTADTTKQPGFASPWHITVAKMAALPYCKTYKKDRVAQLVLDIASERKELKNYYANRSKDERKIIRGRRVRMR